MQRRRSFGGKGCVISGSKRCLPNLETWIEETWIEETWIEETWIETVNHVWDHGREMNDAAYPC